MYFLKRKEDKYEMPAGKATFLRSEIERHLPLFEFRKGHRSTYITTVYFDTEKLDFYKKAKSSYDDNIKIRVKEYYYLSESPTLSPGCCADVRCHTFNHCYVEIKQRLHGLVVKRRFELPKSLLGRLLQGEEVWDDLVASRSGIEFNGCGEVYREFRWFLQRYQVIPKSIINYRRSVYQEDENELRITFDDDLAVFEPLAGLYESSNTLARLALGPPREVWPTIIMEIKCQNGYPAWLRDLIQSLQPKRLSKFTSSLNILTSDIRLTPAEGDSLHFDSGEGGAPRRSGNGAGDRTQPDSDGDTTKASEIKL